MRKVLIAAILAVLALGLTPSYAASETGTYVAGTIDGNGVTYSPVEGVGIAGVQMTLGFDPAKIDIDEVAGGEGVGWIACQDDGDTICGQGNDKLDDGCATGDPQTLSPTFSPGEITVFISTVSISCSGLGVTGTITLST